MASGSGGIFKCLECIHLNILDYITQVYSSIFRYIQVDVCSRQFVCVPGGSEGGRLETTTQVSARQSLQAGRGGDRQGGDTKILKLSLASKFACRHFRRQTIKFWCQTFKKHGAQWIMWTLWTISIRPDTSSMRLGCQCVGRRG